jgi:beta-lactamase class A
MKAGRYLPVLLVGLLALAVPPAAAAPGRAGPVTARPYPRLSLRDRLAAYAESRAGSVSVAVYDGVDHQWVRVHRRDRMVTASIVKVDILQALLHRHGGQLRADQRELATRMIEQSDNNAASELWDQVGGSTGVRRYNRRLGLHETHPHGGGRWGLTRTSAADQVTLVRNLLGRRPSTLSRRSQRFARSLMRHITPAQRWGVSAGPTARAHVGLKNGWLPVSADHFRWAVNSIGWVRGGGRRYEIAVLTAHQPSEGYGIETIEQLSRLVWRHVHRTSTPKASRSPKRTKAHGELRCAHDLLGCGADQGRREGERTAVRGARRPGAVRARQPRRHGPVFRPRRGRDRRADRGRRGPLASTPA